MPKTNRIDTRLNLINEINNIEEPDGLSELSEQITRLRDDGTTLDLKTTQELISLYITCGQGLRDKIQELGKRSRYSETKNMYMRLMKKLSKDYSSLLNYEKYLKNTKEPKDLDIEGFFEKARTRTISLNGQSLDEQKQVGAGQSVRYLVTVPLKDEPVPEKLGLRENDTFTAYFTENNEYVGEQVVYESDEEARDAVLLQVEKDTIKTTVANFPVLRNQIRMPYDGDEHSDIYKFFMNQVPAHYRNAIHRNPERLFTDIDINRIYSDFEDIALDKNNEGMRAFLRNFHNRDAEDRKAAITGLIEYASTLYMASTALDLKQGLGINYFKSTGQRNALMSSVAGLFGCDEVIAFSEKINIKSFETGVEKTRKGVIMMPAEGEDPIHAGLNSNMAKLDRSKMENSPGLNNKIAKLQFLDYICGNPDTLDKIEQTKITQKKQDAAFNAMFDALHALMDYDNHEIRGPLIKKSEGTFVRKDKDDHESVPEYRFVDEPLNKFDLEAFYSLNKEPEDDQSITNSMDEDDNVIHTSVIKEEASNDNEIITTHKAGNRFDDNEIITTTTRKKDVGEIKIQEDSDKDLTPEELSKKYSTLPESIQTIPKSDTYKKLNEALDQVYEYLSDSAALKVMEEYQTIQFCLSDPAYAKDRAQLKADLAKLKNSDEYKKYELARTMRDRLTEQLERYVKVKEECGELRKAAVRVSGMTKAEYDPYERSALQENARQKVQDAQKATEKLNQSAPGQARKPAGPSI